MDPERTNNDKLNRKAKRIYDEIHKYKSATELAAKALEMIKKKVNEIKDEPRWRRRELYNRLNRRYGITWEEYKHMEEIQK